MRTLERPMLLRIFTDEKTRHGSGPMYEAVMLKAREMGLAGGTVLRGVMGFGESGKISSANILDLSINLPLIIEIVDSESKIRAFMPALEAMKDVGLITLENIEVVRYGK